MFLTEQDGPYFPSFTSPDAVRPAGSTGAPGPAGDSVGEAVTRHLTLTPLSPNELAARTGEPIAAILAALLALEIAGLACACPGGRYVAGSALRRSEKSGTRPTKPARRRR